MNNKSTGMAFEREFAQILADHGFWVHKLQDNANGQPFDVIAARNGVTYVFDCKDCQGDTFQLRRMEENQRNAMELWKITGNKPGMFAIRIHGEVILVPYRMLAILEENGKKQADYKELFKCGRKLEQWLEHQDRLDKIGR